MKTRWSIFLLVVCTALAILLIAAPSPSTQARPIIEQSAGQSNTDDLCPTSFTQSRVAQSPTDLFSAGNQSVADFRQAAKLLRTRSVGINFDKLNWQAGSAISLNLFDNVNFTAVLDKVESNSPGVKVWIGHLDGIDSSDVLLAVNGDVMVGNITRPGCLYEIRYTGTTHAIYQVDPRSFPEELDGIPVQLKAAAPIERLAAPADSCTSIDVMVVYDTAARDAAGGTAAMQALIDLAVSETNLGYSHSGIIQRINLVHAEEVVYDETGFDWDTTLDRLTDPADTYMDNVHSLRDTYHADETVMLVNDTTVCGLAWLMTSVSPSFESNAFAVVTQSCATGYYSFAHEMGHNMGSMHDRAAGGGSGAYPYSYGYQAPDKSFRTVMAYNCALPGCPRVNYWSNPDVNYNGQPTGVLYTAADSADNRRSLNNTACTVANWRVSAVTPTLTSLDPDSTLPGGPDFTLTVNGTNFIASSLVQWNGSPRTTTFVDSTQLTAIISATDILITGTSSVTVYNPDGSGTSNALSFIVADLQNVYLPLVAKLWPPIPATPALNAINNAGSGNYTVSWNAASLATSYLLQEAADAAFTSPTPVYSGSGTSWDAISKPVGTNYYRVKASNSYGDSSWSNVQPVTVQPPASAPAGFWAGTGLEFYVTPDKASVSKFAITVNLPGCGTYKITQNTLVSISNKKFSFSGSFYASGTFDSNTAAHGTTGLSHYGPICGSNWSGGPYAWTATWQNSSQPSIYAYPTEQTSVQLVPFSPDYYQVTPAK